jgi:hypothetical protein
MPAGRMEADAAWEWYRRQPWLVGCNYIPSTAVNQLEMWQAETFDPATLRRELDLAAGLGYNTLRVFLHDLAYSIDPPGFKLRLDRFLSMCKARCIRPMLVLFDDCWNTQPRAGRQPDPIPGVHNSGWVQSPGSDKVKNPGSWQRLEVYVMDIIYSFRNDQRILAWDLYNEPGNKGLGEESLPLLKMTFQRARSVSPSQPLTVGIWTDLPEMNIFSANASDVITFHNYSEAPDLENQIDQLKRLNRPVLCTEWLSRPRGSQFVTHLPIFKRENIGCYHWGFVSGKTQTIYPWDSPQDSPEPPVWFHDLLRKDGKPFDPAELRLIRELVPPANKF